MAEQLHYMSERATVVWAATMLGRGAALLIGRNMAGRLFVQDVSGHAVADQIELGLRVLEYTSYPRPAVGVGQR